MLIKIVNIFAQQLFAVSYYDEEFQENEYDRLMDLWTDTGYLHEYAKQNRIKNVNQFVKDRLQDAENIQDLLFEMEQGRKPLEHYFKPLHDNETGIRVLSLQKGKISSTDRLRLYAIKIDENCFVITGGAIKMSQAMQGHPDTLKELQKINQVRDILKSNGVFDKDSFFEFKTEME